MHALGIDLLISLLADAWAPDAPTKPERSQRGIVLHADLLDELRNTAAIPFVVKNGEIFD